MKLAIAQIRSVRGDIAANLEQHQRWGAAAAQLGADIVVFPELSLTGYEPALAKQLAISPHHDCLESLQQLADSDHISIGVGVPTLHDLGICISLVWLHPQSARQVYHKQFIHQDEEPFFIRGHNSTSLIATATQVSTAICYELSVSTHVTTAIQQGAQIYLASVAKSATGVHQAHLRLQAIAQQYAMPVMMVNCVGACEDFDSAGGSAIWNRQGHCLDQLDSTQEGLLLLDTNTDQVFSKVL
ncbi:MAG: carbon-nitrogen hydrolase family protein [Leptolyngbya sp. SIOISBB]|nr:carbon-nitrogen hydrolase family protein [Leptolyngbya sp. SIOISBB]